MNSDPLHHVEVRFIKSRRRYEGSCTHPNCAYALSAPNTPAGRASAQANADFHANRKAKR